VEGGCSITVDTAQSYHAADHLLDAWRQKATDVLLTASVPLLLPMLILALFGYGFSSTWPFKILSLATYLILVANALARHADYRIRVWIMVVSGYFIALLGSMLFPHRPFFRALPIIEAVLILVLIGARPAHIATLASACVLILGSFLHTMPGLVHLFIEDGAFERIQSSELVMQVASMTALLLGLMLLLTRFHAILLQALAAQQQATDAMKQESVERAAAFEKLGREIEERRRLERELARIGDEERRRLGQDVHDGVCQQITGALLRCQALERRIARGDAMPVRDLNALSALLEEAIDEAHNVAQGLQPLEPESGALAQALRTLAKRTQATGALRCQFVAIGETAVPDPALAQHLHRIAQEAVSNAVRHADAGQIVITLQGGDNELVLQVEDDGHGLTEPLSSGGMGMRTMAFRAQIVGGTLAVDTAANGGVRIICRAPLPCAAMPSLVVMGSEE
jgi:signal transduction histidine kinase